MNHKRLISLTICLILTNVPGISSLILADIAPETDKKAQQHFDKANELRKLANYKAAILEYEKVISLSPNSKIAQNAQYWVGQSYFESKQFDAALSAFQSLLDEYPTSTIVSSTKLMIERVQQAKKYYPFFDAVRKGDTEQVRLHISKGVDVNVKDDKDKTPLHYAAQAGEREVVQLLIEADADLDCKDKDGETPTKLAIANDHIDVVDLLILKGADDSLHSSAYLGDLKKVKNFIESGIDVDAKGEYGVTPLYLSLINRLHKDVAEFLLEKGANPNTKDKVDATLLHAWAWGGDPDITKSLIEFLASKGADVNALQGVGRWTPLHSACYRGRGSVAKVLIDNGADVNTKDNRDRTPLHYTVRYKDLSTTSLLIAKGADVNAQRNNGETPLLIAADCHDMELLELIISNGADITAKDKKGHTVIDHCILEDWAPRKYVVELLTSKGAGVSMLRPIHLAAYLGNFDQVKAYVDTGNNVNARSKRGRCPLHTAAVGGQREIIEFLLANGAYINARDEFGDTPLHYAVRPWEARKDVIELLLAKGADINAKGNWGYTPVDVASSMGPKWAVKLLLNRGGIASTIRLAARAGDMARLKDQIKSGADIEDVKILDNAASRGYTEVVSFLIKQGADVNAKRNDGWTPLHSAAYNRHEDTARILLTAGANVNAKTRRGTTPLHAAVSRGYKGPNNEDVVRILLEKRAEVNARDNNGYTALDVAAERTPGLGQMLLAKGAKVTTLESAAYVGDVEKVKSFIKRGVDFRVKTSSGGTPLHAAARGGQKIVVELLIAEGADIHVKNRRRRTALDEAVRSGHNDVAELLLAKGPDIEVSNRAFLDAIEGGHKSIVELLLANGADVNEDCGWTLLQGAAWADHKEIVELLISKGAKVDVKNSWGHTALTLAEERGHTEIVELLRKHGAKE